jgi:hypothetical protein
MKQGRKVPGRAPSRAVPGQPGFVRGDAAEPAEGLRKPEGGTGEGPAPLASCVRFRRAQQIRAPGAKRRRDEEPQERRTRSASASWRENGESRVGQCTPAVLRRGVEPHERSFSSFTARLGNLDAEHPEAELREDDGMGGAPEPDGALRGEADPLKGTANPTGASSEDGDVFRPPVEALESLEGPSRPSYGTATRPRLSRHGRRPPQGEG